MSSKVCPNTCGQLSTAAVFISIGVVQLLAGIILLKSEYVYLLAGIDFIAAVSNISVGIFLGIASSLWENKPKEMTGKNIARQNILAGLYISVMVVNATTAIVMIMGEGNKLLTIPENVERNNSAVFVLEIMACAYVTSVCSPIVCIVVALVCLSGNRIQIHENMKERENIAKTESYGWVFRNNHGTGPKKISDVIQSPLNRNSSSSDEVFLEKKCCMNKRSFLKKFSKKKNSKNSMSSLEELKSPLEIWDQKRKKILQEITEPNKVFFSDNYLQFPEISSGSYIETILPRIRPTSLIHPKTGETTLSLKRPTKRTLHKPSHLHLDEVDTRPSNKVDKLCDNSNYENRTLPNLEAIQPEEVVTDSLKRYYSVQYKNEKFCKNSSNGSFIPKMAPSRYAYSSSSSFSVNNNPVSGLVSRCVREIPNSVQSSSHNQKKRHIKAQNSIKSSVFAINSEAIDELKTKFNEIRFDEAATVEDRKEFMKSFKNGTRKGSAVSESDRENGSELVQNTTENARSDEIMKSNLLAGEVVPIAVRTPNINPVSSIPVSSVTSRVSEWQSLEDLSSSDSLKESLRSSSSCYRNRTNHEFPRRATSLYDKTDKCKPIRKLDFHPNKISTPPESENQQDKARSRSIMTSIPESPEEIISDHSVADHEALVPRKEKSEFKLSRAYTCKNNPALPKHNKLKSSQSTHFLKRLWSSAETESKTDLSNLIMDSDSLIGLSDEELLNRTRRLRELRKSVITRLKNEENSNSTVKKKLASIEI